jgi:hypothetical protein
MLSEWTGPQNLRSIHEDARNVARDIAKTEDYQTSCKQRKKVEMLFAHLKNGFYGWGDCACEARLAPKMSFCSPQRPSTCGKWPSSDPRCPLRRDRGS